VIHWKNKSFDKHSDLYSIWVYYYVRGAPQFYVRGGFTFHIYVLFTFQFYVGNFTFVRGAPQFYVRGGFTFLLRSNFTFAILRSFVVRRNFTYYHVRGAPQRNFWDDRESSTQLASLLSMQFDCKPLLDSHPRLRIFSCASVSRNYINRRRSINGRWDAWRMYEFP